MSETEDDQLIKKLREFDKHLDDSTDKEQNVQDYEGIIELSKANIKTKKLGAQLIPRYFKFFPSLKIEAFEAYLDIIQEVNTECLTGYVTEEEFETFMDFWNSLSTLEEKDGMQKVVEILEQVANLHSPLKVLDTNHIDRFISCLQTALPFYAKGAQGSHRNFAYYLNKNIMPVFDQLPEAKLKKLNLLRAVAKRLLYPTDQEARQMLEQDVNRVKKAPDRPDSLNLLPDDCKELLNERGTCHLNEEHASLLVDLQKLRDAKHEGPFILNDNNHVAQLCCRMKESELLPFMRLLGTPWIPILGEVRDQLSHLLCWAYASSDQFNGVRILHNLEKRSSPPLCTWYLCCYCNPEELQRRANIEEPHHCYGFTIEMALLHIKTYGIPRELVKVFDCKVHQPSSVVCDILMKKRTLKNVRRINTLEEALQELQWQPIGADVAHYKGMGEQGRAVYYGPADIRIPDPYIVGYHSVIIAGLDIIDHELVAVCKDSHGYFQGDDGYIYVSLSTLYIPVGVDREGKKLVRGYSEFMHLLTNFVAIDMDVNEDEDEKGDAGKDEEAREEEEPKEEEIEDDPSYVEYEPVAKRRRASTGGFSSSVVAAKEHAIAQDRKPKKGRKEFTQHGSGSGNSKDKPQISEKAKAPLGGESEGQKRDEFEVRENMLNRSGSQTHKLNAEELPESNEE